MNTKQHIKADKPVTAVELQQTSTLIDESTTLKRRLSAKFDKLSKLHCATEDELFCEAVRRFSNA